ncbi:MAG: hypothetical protein WB988_12315 [Candidatus Nitrosopolaris sp.]
MTNKKNKQKASIIVAMIMVLGLVIVVARQSICRMPRLLWPYIRVAYR